MEPSSDTVLYDEQLYSEPLLPWMQSGEEMDVISGNEGLSEPNVSAEKAGRASRRAKNKKTSQGQSVQSLVLLELKRVLGMTAGASEQVEQINHGIIDLRWK